MPTKRKPKKTTKPRSKASSRPKRAAVTRSADEKKRLWLTYPRKTIQRPVIYELGHRFGVVTNLRQASVTEEVGIVSLEVDGPREEIKKAIRWMERLGIKVEPVEINVIEG